MNYIQAAKDTADKRIFKVKELKGLQDELDILQKSITIQANNLARLEERVEPLKKKIADTEAEIPLITNHLQELERKAEKQAEKEAKLAKYNTMKEKLKELAGELGIEASGALVESGN